jgi:hypothetical protein
MGIVKDVRLAGFVILKGKRMYAEAETPLIRASTLVPTKAR